MDSLVLDSNYVELINKINNYLSLKVSESDKFINLLDSLNVYYSSLVKIIFIHYIVILFIMLIC